MRVRRYRLILQANRIKSNITDMMKKQLFKFCRSWLPAGTTMLCSLTMMVAEPFITPSVAQVQKGVKMTQVTGLVTDQAKEPLVGVTISAVGTSNLAITDIDGMFHIDVPAQNNAVLEFSYVGYKKTQVKVNGAKLLNVMLEEEATEFNEYRRSCRSS